MGRDELGSELELVEQDLELIEQIILDSSAAQIPFLTESATYLTRAGGKRIRPAIVLLCSLLGSGPNDEIRLTAAAIEMTHLATLYHDDVIDEADLRRGVPSANEKWGNTVAILAGDYLFARASAVAAEVGGEVPHVLSAAISEVIQGQVRELERTFDPRRTKEHYFATIQEKTASLLEASARLGVGLAECDQQVVGAIGGFAAAFGLAFQIADDLLDLSAQREDLGKPPGTDLRDGVYTLPVILAVDKEPSLAAMLGRPDADLALVTEKVVSSGAFREAVDEASRHSGEAAAALASLPDSPAKRALEAVNRIVVERVPQL